MIPIQSVLASTRFRLLALLMLLAVFGPAILAAAKPQMTIGHSEIIATVTPGGSVILIGVGREFDGRAVSIMKRNVLLADDDHNGTVTYVSPSPIPSASVWILADLSGGEYAMTASAEWPLLRRPIPAAAFVSRGQGKNGVIANDRDIFMVVIRPGVGGWSGTLTDGSSRDEDSLVDGRVTVLAEHLTAIGTTPAAPGQFQRDDIVFYVNPLTLTISDGRVVK